MCVSVSVEAQITGNTVGLIQNSTESYDGYTLINSINSETVYLIDNCGYIVHQWDTDQKPGLSAYIGTQGELIRTARVTGSFNAGGSGGLVQKYSWDGDLLWESYFSDSVTGQHHDIEPLDNGNILVLAWESIGYNAAIEMGCNPDLILETGVWLEQILEVKPTGINTYDLVWKWQLKDHLIQDFDATKSNFGVVADHPELLNINYRNNNEKRDLFHANSIDYRADLDQILLNSRNWNEFYILDHSTTLSESKQHSGGQASMGGDVLYRYGNPATYNRGDSTHQKLYLQHGTRWIESGYPNEGDVIIFNNGVGRPQGDFSSVEMISPPLEGFNYSIQEDEAYGPDDFLFSYVGSPISSFYSSRICNAVALPNGNILVDDGQDGYLFEINKDKEKVWEYINPVTSNTAVEQGSPNPNSGIFAVEKYSSDYPGFLGRELIPDRPIELFSLYDCTLFNETSVSTTSKNGYSIVQNPINGTLQINNHNNHNCEIKIFDIFGAELKYIRHNTDNLIDVDMEAPRGMYLLYITNANSNQTIVIKVINQ